MWKKIGAIGPASNDNKSSRSRDQNAYEPFSQMSKLRMSESQLFLQNNQYFGQNIIGKIKTPQAKCFSQSRIKTQKQLQHAKSYKEISTSNNQSSNIKKKALNQEQMEQLKYKITRQLIDQIDDSGQKQPLVTCDNQNMRQTQSTEMIGSQTSIQGAMKKLKQCKSTPQLNFAPISSITQQIWLDKKIQTQKNLNQLKKQHGQIKKTLKNELSQFKKSFNSMEKQIKNKISTVLLQNQKKHQQKMIKSQVQKQSNSKRNLLNFTELQSTTKRFGDTMKGLNDKKMEILNKYMSLRVK